MPYSCNPDWKRKCEWCPFNLNNTDCRLFGDGEVSEDEMCDIHAIIDALDLKWQEADERGYWRREGHKDG